MYFSADDGTSGRELWKSDGTPAGTVMVKDILEGKRSSNTGALKAIGDKILFSANDGIAGQELWLSDGTATGTRMTQDIVAGSGSSSPGNIIEANGKIFLTAVSEQHGRELYIGNTFKVLPLTLVDFSGSLHLNDAFLHWKTAHEINTGYFEIERSTDGRTFTKTGTLSAIGARNNSYTYTDKNVVSRGGPVIYYRLKIIDNDGSFKYSNIVLLNIRNKHMVGILYPNPVKERTTLLLTSDKIERITYTITDAAGRTLIGKSLNVTDGSNMIFVDTKTLSAGIYFLIIRGEETTKHFRFVKQ